ncbi:MAG: VPLPA-CTERM sorting domain-containing protein [Pseudomonadota bacterium]
MRYRILAAFFLLPSFFLTPVKAEEGNEVFVRTAFMDTHVTAEFDSVVFTILDATIEGEVTFTERTIFSNVFDLDGNFLRMDEGIDVLATAADFTYTFPTRDPVFFDGAFGSADNATFFNTSLGTTIGSPVFELRPEDNVRAFLANPFIGRELDIALLVLDATLTRFAICNDTSDGDCNPSGSITDIVGVVEGNLVITEVEEKELQVVPLPAALWMFVAAIGGLGVIARRQRTGHTPLRSSGARCAGRTSPA